MCRDHDEVSAVILCSMLSCFLCAVFCLSATPLPEEFELQGFLALRPSFRWVTAKGSCILANVISSTDIVMFLTISYLCMFTAA